MQGSLKSKKNLVKLAFFVWLGVLGIVGVGLAGRFLSGITQSDETNEIFNAAAELPPALLESVVWEPDRPDLRRKMEPLTRIDVTAAWIRAWEQLSIVAQTGDTTGLEVYFSNSALEALLASTEDTDGRPVHQVAHRLRVDFYSQDGQVLGLTAPEVKLVRSVPIGDELGWVQTTESFEVVMLLEDGNFRIQHWVRRQLDRRWWTDPPEPATDATDFAVDGINYYPRDTPFDRFWSSFDEDVVGQDLDRVRDLGFDSIRIFLPFDELKGRWTTEEELAPVLQLMDLAEQRELGVVVTLFDGRTDHRVDKWDSDRAHIEAVVPALADHSALLLWDLKNEPDRDIGANGVDEQLMYAWLTHVAHEVRANDPRTPTTIGWSTPAAALAAPVVTDVVSFHYYGPVADLTFWGEAVRDHADGRPVLLTEYGLPTWNSIFPGGHTEAEQAFYTAEIRRTLVDLDLSGSMIWTLWDLAAGPPDAGILPWSVGPQTTLGILRADGSPKPVAEVVGRDADPMMAVAPGLLHRFTKTFWKLTFIAVFGLFVLWYLGGRAKALRTTEPTKPRHRSTPGP